MKLLRTEFVANNDQVGNTTFKQIRKFRGVALYQRFKGNKHFCYEVFVYKTIKAGTPLPGGKKVEEDYEQYPGAAQWGKTAWSPNTLDVAADRFDTLVAKLKSEDGQPKRRGRKSIITKTLVLPRGDFTMKMLIAETGLSQPILYIRLQALLKAGKLKEVRREKSESGRGRAAVVYRA